MSVELRHLRYFVAITETLSFRKAAEHLQIAQPALSQQIRKLEQELGVQLFDRSRRQVRLTNAGAVFAEKARITLASAAEAVRSTREAGRCETGRLSIGVVTSALYGIFPDVVRVFHEQYPKVHIDLHELPVVQQAEWLLSGRIDASFLRPPLEEQGLVVHLIVEERWVAAMPESHPLASRRTIPLKSLEHDPFILFPRSLAPSLYDQVLALCHDAGFSPRISLEAQMQTIVNLVAAGLGVALVPQSLVNLRRKGLTYKRLADPAPKVALAVAWRDDDTSPVLHTFLQVVTRVAGRLRRKRE